MVDDMLFLAKADNGKITPSAEDASIAEIAASVIEYYELAAEEKCKNRSFRRWIGEWGQINAKTGYFKHSL